MTNKLSQVLSFEAKDAIKALVDVEGGLDDVESKGKLVAKALDAMATDIDADLKGSAAAADALGAALGPELEAKIGRAGVEDFVVKLKSIGLTSDQIVTDVDDLAASIKHLDDIGRNLDGPKQGLKDVADSADHTKTKLGEMRGEGDNSRSVLANMVGNSAQDVAGLGGVAGTAGMALGQLGEYATEGNISLQGLAKVAGPMALVSIAALGISSALGQIAKEKAFETHRVEQFTKALEEGKTAAEAWDAALTDTKKVDFIDAATGDVADLTHTLSENNITWAEFKSHLDQGKEAFDAWSLGLNGSLAHNDDANNLWQAGNQLLDEQAKAVETLNDKHKVFGDTAVEAAAKAKQAAADYDAQVATTSADVQREIDAMTAKWDEINGHINAEKSMIQYKQQVDGVRQAIADAGAAELQFGVGSPEAIAAKDNARLKTLELESTTASLGATILGLPPEKVTDLLVKIDQNDLDGLPETVQRALDNKTYRVSAHLDAIKIDGETHAAGSTSISVGGKSTRIQSAAGGYFPPKPGGTDITVAEAGKGEWVVPDDQMRGGGGGIIVNIYNAGFVMAERDLARLVADGIVDGQRRGEITAGFLVSP